MRTAPFYALIAVPLLLLVLLMKFGLIGPGAFTILLLTYALVYHPTIVGLRLLAKHTIQKDDFVKTYIPFWNTRYFSETFFS